LRIGKVDEAMDWISKAIEHTPTVVELYLVKAKIFQYAGNRVQAYNLTEEARNLDRADRYLNAHSSKFLLKAGETKRAWETMSMFSKTDENGDPNIHEMQT
jgi:peptide alpha-N-acetyltransferase